MKDIDRPYEGAFVGGDHRFAIRVYFEDTDAGGVVYHSNYLRYMERARSDMLRAAGIDQRRAIDDGIGVYVVAEVNIRYRAPAMLDDAIMVVSRMGDVRASSAFIHQRVMRGNDVLTEASVTVALTRNGRPVRQPREWIDAFERLKGESE